MGGRTVGEQLGNGAVGGQSMCRNAEQAAPFWDSIAHSCPNGLGQNNFCTRGARDFGLAFLARKEPHLVPFRREATLERLEVFKPVARAVAQSILDNPPPQLLTGFLHHLFSETFCLGTS
jgi:hypothetical protein